MKKKAKRIARMMANISLNVLADMIVDEYKGIRYEVYSDGSCKDGFCGCGWLVLHSGALVNSGRATYNCTNSIEIEIRAVIHALSDCPFSSHVDVYLDCQAAIRVITKQRLRPILKAEYDKASKGKAIRFYWVRSHHGNIYNEMADSLAYNAAKDKNKALKC